MLLSSTPQDSAAHALSSLKTTIFIWEVVITAVVFTAAWFILKKFKNKEKEAKENNKKFFTGS